MSRQAYAAALLWSWLVLTTAMPAAVVGQTGTASPAFQAKDYAAYLQSAAANAPRADEATDDFVRDAMVAIALDRTRRP